MDDSRRQLLESLTLNGLIPSQVARSLLSSRQLGEQGDSPEELVSLLVAEGHLTRFQAQAICEKRIDVLVLGNYVLLSPIGQGGMGEVYQARHRRMDRVVALKLLRADVCSSVDRVQRFQREVRAAARLSHPNIVTAYDADEVGGQNFLVMEYVEGQDLARLVSRLGPLGVSEAVECITQVAAGLGYAHDRGVIHRDLKPSNVLVDRHGCARILDLGLARLEEIASASPSAASLTGSEQIVGTVDYMAPEQAANSRGVDRRADIYALGCTLYFLLTGRPMYARGSLMERLLAHQQEPVPSLSETRSDVPPPLNGIFHRMVAKQPTERPDSARDLLAALTEAGLAPANASGQLGTRVIESMQSSDAVVSETKAISEDLLPPHVEPAHPPMPLTATTHRRASASLVGGVTAGTLLLVIASSWLWYTRSSGDGASRLRAKPGASAATKVSPHTDGIGPKVESLARSDEDRDRAVALCVLQWGGSLEVHIGEEKRSISAAGELPAEPFRIVQIGLGDCQIGDEQLHELHDLTGLEELALWNTMVSDSGIGNLRGITALRALYLSGTAVRGLGLRTLTGLKWLELNGAPIDDDGLKHVATLTHLECLYLNGTQVSDAGLERLRGLVSLKELYLEQTNVSPQGVARLRSAIPGCVVHFGE